jgi:hypothetical protein
MARGRVSQYTHAANYGRYVRCHGRPLRYCGRAQAPPPPARIMPRTARCVQGGRLSGVRVQVGFYWVNCKVTWRCRRRSSHRGSARKHGVSDVDILHTYANPIRVFDLDEGFTMVIGASLAAIIYEIGVVDGVTASVIVHAMRAREKFLR